MLSTSGVGYPCGMNTYDMERGLREEFRAGGAAMLEQFADRAFARATDAGLVIGNTVRILRDATENFPAWLEAIRSAQRSIFFESYIIADDEVGREFAYALAERARAGVRVRLIYDWLGTRRSGALWKILADAGVDVRAFNPPRFDDPIGWVTRDHRKMIAVDGRIGFVTGLCVSSRWCGDAQRSIEPWRDTGIEIRGPAVVELEDAFAQVWSSIGAPLPDDAFTAQPAPPDGDVALRVIASAPTTASLYRLDQLIASMASERLWLTDAYFVGITPYVRALCAAANDGVDVRLLVPGASDLPIVSRLSRTGYRPLLEAGIRVFEWNGSMLHAKTAVADHRWARVGSTNLNFASWMSNYELDVAVENEDFARQMAAMYEDDLTRATEIVLGRRNRVTVAREGRMRGRSRRALSGSAGRAAAGALSVGSAFGAALTHRRVLSPTDASLLGTLAAVLLGVAVIALVWPAVLAIPIAIVAAWLGSLTLWRAFKLYRGKRHAARGDDAQAAPTDWP